MQIINGENLVQYLFDKGFVEPDTVVNSEMKIIPVSSRNRNFKVFIKSRPGYLVKQVSIADEEKILSLRQEATLFWLVKNDPLYDALSAFLPAFHDFDAAESLLIIELIENSQDLFDYYKINNGINDNIFKQLAQALATVHSISAKQISTSPSSVFFPGKIPWIFFIGPDYTLPPKNNVDVQIMKLVSSNKEFIFYLNQLRAQWSQKSLIHGDVKWVNILVSNENKLKVIDWEISDTGDPAWDIAGVFQSVLNSWCFNGSGNNSGKQFPNTQRIPMKFFWNSYCEKMGYSEQERKKQLQKAISYTGIRIIQTCLESTFRVTEFHDNTARYLQMAHNILRYCDEAQTELFGIDY